MTIAIAGGGSAHVMAHGPNAFTSGTVDTTGATLLTLCTGLNPPPITVTDNKGNTWVKMFEFQPTGGAYTQLWMTTAAPIVGTGHTFTVTGTSSFCRALMIGWTGNNASSDLIDRSSGGGSSGIIDNVQPGPITPITGNQLIITTCCFGGSGLMTIDSGYTIIDQGPQISFDCFGLAVAYTVQTASVATNPTWSLANGNGKACLIASVPVAPYFPPGAHSYPNIA